MSSSSDQFPIAQMHGAAPRPRAHSGYVSYQQLMAEAEAAAAAEAAERAREKAARKAAALEAAAGGEDAEPPLLFRGGDRGVVDAGASLEEEAPPPTPSSKEEGALEPAPAPPREPCAPLHEIPDRVRDDEVCLGSEGPTAPRTVYQHHQFAPDRQVRFCDHLSAHGNVRMASAFAGISPETAYKARRRDPLFAKCWDEALVLARSHAEAVLADRALEGREVPVYYHGEEVAQRRQFSDRLLLAHLARLDAHYEKHAAAGAPEDFDMLLAELAGREASELGPRADYVAWRGREAEDAFEQAERAGLERGGDEWDETSTDALICEGAYAREVAGAAWDAEKVEVCGFVDRVIAGEWDFPPHDPVHSVHPVTFGAPSGDKSVSAPPATFHPLAPRLPLANLAATDSDRAPQSARRSSIQDWEPDNAFDP